MTKKYYFCDFEAFRISNINKEIFPLASFIPKWHRQSYNPQQHIVRVESKTEYKIFNPLGPYFSLCLYKLFKKSFHSITSYKAYYDNHDTIQYYWPYMHCKKNNLDIHNCLDGFSRKTSKKIISQYFEDKQKNELISN